MTYTTHTYDCLRDRGGYFAPDYIEIEKHIEGLYELGRYWPEEELDVSLGGPIHGHGYLDDSQSIHVMRDGICIAIIPYRTAKALIGDQPMTQQEKAQQIATYFRVSTEAREKIGRFCTEIWLHYYADDYDAAAEDEYSTMVTLGADCDDNGTVTYALQSGDNSFTGNAYGFPYWGVLYPHQNTPEGFADELIESLIEALPS